jgi:hypothetical protein
VRADGELLICEPATVLPMAQRYFLFWIRFQKTGFLKKSVFFLNQRLRISRKIWDSLGFGG